MEHEGGDEVASDQVAYWLQRYTNTLRYIAVMLTIITIVLILEWIF